MLCWRPSCGPPVVPSSVNDPTHTTVDPSSQHISLQISFICLYDCGNKLGRAPRKHFNAFKHLIARGSSGSSLKLLVAVMQSLSPNVFPPWLVLRVLVCRILDRLALILVDIGLALSGTYSTHSISSILHCAAPHIICDPPHRCFPARLVFPPPPSSY